MSLHPGCPGPSVQPIVQSFYFQVAVYKKIFSIIVSTLPCIITVCNGDILDIGSKNLPHNPHITWQNVAIMHIIRLRPGHIHDNFLGSQV